MSNINYLISLVKNNNIKRPSKKVIELIETHKCLYEKNEEFLFELGKFYFLSGDSLRAKKCFNKLLKINKQNIYAMDLLGKIYLNDKNTNKAIKMFNNIIKIDTKYYSAWKDLFNLYLNNGKYNKIIKYFEKNLTEEDVFVYYVVLMSYLKTGNKNKALNLINKFFKILDKKHNKINENEMLNLARAFADINEYEIVIDLCNLLDSDYTKINHFYNTIHFSLSKYLQNLRVNSVQNNNFVTICNNLLNKIPKKIVKIRNIILNEKEIYEKQIVLKSKPRYATFVLTTMCNLKCKMCKQASINWYMDDKHVEQIKKLIPYLQYVTWHGGEVFFHKRFWELFKFAILNDVEQEIITNGTLIEDWMLDEFVNSKLQLTLSIDAINKIDYENIRVGASFDKIINLLEKLKKKKNETSHKNFILKLNVIVSKINYKTLYTFVDFANRYNINKIYFFPLNNIDIKSFYNEYKEIVMYLDKNIDKVIKKANDFGIEIETNLPTMNDLKSLYGNLLNNNKHEYVKNFNNCETNINFECKNKNLFCVVPWQRIRIDKYIRPYCFCKKNIGNFDENFNILKIWNNKYMKIYRKMIKNNNFKLLCNTNCLEVSSKIRKEFKGIILE